MEYDYAGGLEEHVVLLLETTGKKLFLQNWELHLGRTEKLHVFISSCFLFFQSTSHEYEVVTRQFHRFKYTPELEELAYRIPFLMYHLIAHLCEPANFVSDLYMAAVSHGADVLLKIEPELMELLFLLVDFDALQERVAYKVIKSIAKLPISPHTPHEEILRRLKYLLKARGRFETAAECTWHFIYNRFQSAIDGKISVGDLEQECKLAVNYGGELIKTRILRKIADIGSNFALYQMLPLRTYSRLVALAAMDVVSDTINSTPLNNILACLLSISEEEICEYFPHLHTTTDIAVSRHTTGTERARYLYELVCCNLRDNVYIFGQNMRCFEALRKSLLCALICDDQRPYVGEYLISELAPLFQASDDYSQDLNFILNAETAAIDFLLAPLAQPSPMQLEEAEAIITSPLLSQIYRTLGLSSNFACWKNRIYFAPLLVHGMTLFSGTVLINEKYTGISDDRRVAFLITLLHESAHVALRTRGLLYDARVVSPPPNYQLISGALGTKKYDKLAEVLRKNDIGFQLEMELFGKIVAQVFREQQRFLLTPSTWSLSLGDFVDGLRRRTSESLRDVMHLAREHETSLLLPYEGRSYCVRG